MDDAFKPLYGLVKAFKNDGSMPVLTTSDDYGKENFGNPVGDWFGSHS